MRVAFVFSMRLSTGDPQQVLFFRQQQPVFFSTVVHMLSHAFRQQQLWDIPVGRFRSLQAFFQDPHFLSLCHDGSGDNLELQHWAVAAIDFGHHSRAVQPFWH